MAETKQETVQQAPNYEAIYKYIVDTLTSELASQEKRLESTANCFDYLKTTVSADAVKSILAFIKGLVETK